MSEYIIEVNQVSKMYKMYDTQKEKIKDFFLPWGCGKEFYALENVSLKIKRGDVIGIVGQNGSGKSTLTEIIAGITSPTKGSVKVDGKVSIVAVSAGLNGKLTGLENIELKGYLNGYDTKKIRDLKEDIIQFADIGEHISQPVKTYSSGMKARLGFAISVVADPEILIVDEALSVGDQCFVKKCEERMKSIISKGGTVIIVSHSLNQIKRFCNTLIWLERGKVRNWGPVKNVLPQYEKYLSEEMS